MMCQNKKAQKVFLVTLFFLVFFGLNIVPGDFTKLDYVLTPALFFLTIGCFSWKSRYSKLIIIYIIFVFFSCLYSMFFNHQAIYYVIIHSYPFWSLVFFFYLKKNNLSSSDAETILFKLAILCCCCYVIQWLIYPIVLFAGAESENAVTDSEYRVRICGTISCYCLFLYGANKYIINKKFKYLFSSFLAFFPIIIMGFRSLTFLSLASLFIMIILVYRNARKTIIMLFVVLIISFFISQIDIVKSKINEMGERNDTEQTFLNDNYIRWIELDYYWNEQFTKPMEKFFGGGWPTDPTSKYAKDIYQYAYVNHLYWDDLGIVGLGLIIGMPAVLILSLLYFTCIWKCKEPALQYIRFTLLTVFLGSILMTCELFRTGNILLLSFFLYIEEKYHQENVIKYLS